MRYYRGLGFVGPRRVIAKPTTARRPTWTTGRAVSPTVSRAVSRGAPRSVVGDPRAMPPQTRRTTEIPYYDPSRVIDEDRLVVVDDMRQQGAERGEVQEGDAGTLGPGSRQGAFATRDRTTIVTGPQREGLTGGQLALLAALGYILLGG